MTDQPDLDPELTARLRELADARIRQQIASAKQKAQDRKQIRQQFARNRDHGLQERHALRTARLRLTNRFEQGDQQP